MVGIGAPDWQSSQTYGDVTPLFNGVFNCPNAFTQLFSASVAEWIGLAVQVQVVTADALLQVQWFADPAFATLTAQRTYDLPTSGGNPFNFTLPNLGAYVVFSTKTLAGVANNGNIVVVGTNRVGPSFFPVGFFGLIEQDATAVGAGGTSVVDFNGFFAGPMSFTFYTALATGSVRLWSVDLTGTTHTFFYAPFPIPASGLQVPNVMVPPAHCQIRVANTTGGAGTYFAFGMPDAWRNYS